MNKVVGACLVGVALQMPFGGAQGQPGVQLPLTEQFTMKSARNGIEYRIDVRLPAGLDTMQSRPSVFYVTDGNPFFPLGAELYSTLALGGDQLPLIVVGVSYPESDGPGFTPGYVVHRTRDYTPTSITEMPGGGGSASYLAFLKEELIPLVESRWRADSSGRGVGGHSLGGLFVTYALTHEPTLFSRYWIGSPSLWWDKQVAFTWLDRLKSKSPRPRSRAYVTVGALESDVMVPPAQRLARELKTVPNLQAGIQVFPDETHGSVIGGAMSRALRFLYGDYGRATIAMSPAMRAGFAGTWVSEDKRRLVIRQKPTGLELQLSENGVVLRAPLVGASADSLFTRKFPIRITAVRGQGGRIANITSAMAGMTTTYSRQR